MRWQKEDSKSNICTEAAEAYVTDISVEFSAQYAGASHRNAELPTTSIRKLGVTSFWDEVIWFTTLRQQSAS